MTAATVKSKFILAKAFLRYLTWKKIVNVFLLYGSFHWSRLVKRPHMQGLPTALSVEPTTGCNLRCPECPSGLRSFTRPTGMLDKALYQKIIQESQGHLSYLHLYFQGEPFLHPELLDLVRYADERKIFTATSTNAHFLTKKTVPKVLASGLKQLIVSVDGASQGVYEQYRIGGKLDRVKEGIALLLQERKASGKRFPQVIFQFLVTGKNEHELPAIRALAAALAVDELQLKTAQIYDYEKGSELIPKDLRYSRYLPQKNGKWILKKPIRNKCWRMWQGAVVTWDGDVVPCCFDKDASHKMGNLGETALSHIWSTGAYNTFRKQLLEDRKQIEICKNCSE
ncbi:radical SAM/SPASM domain-containing protein [Echinicola vietnamensis]|uniref:Putative Fe-S oxidoreductase n=1 Tax=Echinicola vietnamensis (strain DSM 17526 / LMG 23754 / KMM 6221) TaxID=926556 RepID=L0FTJ0_ECHVK|nr:radical SAM/SPASM domain-containing protein [Echinicola vietnamensis]AGA77229.1 putative Fe-S oxidoreductase [Echinicola vietnamensis DSM 17526]